MFSQQCFLLDNCAFWSLQMQLLSQVSHEETLQKTIRRKLISLNTEANYNEVNCTPKFNLNFPRNSWQAQGSYSIIKVNGFWAFLISQSHHNAIKKNPNLQCVPHKPTQDTGSLKNICCKFTSNETQMPLTQTTNSKNQTNITKNSIVASATDEFYQGKLKPNTLYPISRKSIPFWLS